jgi:hypothetical protein
MLALSLWPCSSPCEKLQSDAKCRHEPRLGGQPATQRNRGGVGEDAHQKCRITPPLATILCWVLELSATFRFGLPEKKSRISPRKLIERNSL